MGGGGGNNDDGGIGRCPTPVLDQTEAASRPVSSSSLPKPVLAPTSKTTRPTVHVNATPIERNATPIESLHPLEESPARTSPWLCWLSSIVSSLHSASRWRLFLDMRPISFTGSGPGSSPSPSLQPPSMLAPLSRIRAMAPLSRTRTMPLSVDHGFRPRPRPCPRPRPRPVGSGSSS